MPLLVYACVCVSLSQKQDLRFNRNKQIYFLKTTNRHRGLYFWFLVLYQKWHSCMKLVQLEDCGKCGWNNIPTDPPVESWQNSNRPSNTGQSSPTLTVSNRTRQKQSTHADNKDASASCGRYADTHISASACYTQTCCLVGWTSGT